MVEPTIAIGVVGAIIILGVLVSRLSEKIKFPHILVLILLGLLIGPVFKLFDPGEYTGIIQAVVTFALIIVLFDAGYEIKIGRLKKELMPSLRLTVPAIILSIVAAMAFSMLFFKFSWQTALLLGAIIASTDITIVAPLLKVFEIKPQIKDILNLEATMNSVFAIIVATIVVGITIVGEGTLYTATQAFLYQTFVGVGLGVVFGYILIFLLKHVKIEQMPEILSIGAILLIYAVSQYIGASGIFAVFVAGIVFGNAPETKLKKVITSFQASLAFLIIVFVYVILGTMLKLNVLLGAGIAGAIFAILIALSRAPAAWGFKLNWEAKDKFLFLVGPRGMTCVVLALFFVSEFPDPDLALGLVFMVVLVSVIIASVSHRLVKTEELIKPQPQVKAKTKRRRRKK